METNEILIGEHLSKTYGEKKILDGISFSLKEGELLCLLGVSGVGKTTLFNVLSGISKPDEGNVFLRKEDAKEDEDAYLNITGKTGYLSYMLQKDLLLPHKYVIDNVALPMILKGMKKKEAREAAAEHFKQFGLEGCEYKYPSELSGGMRQRAAFLRTYLVGNRVVLLDEPFSALDAITKAGMQEWFLQVMDELKLSAVFITHDIDEAILLSDRIYIMTGAPATLTKEIAVERPKPRNQAFTLTDGFMEYKKEIRRLLFVDQVAFS